MFVKQKLLLQTLLNKSSENVDATALDEITSETGSTSTDKKEGNEEVFTQEQVNKIVSKRVREVKNQYKDYDDLRQTVTAQQEKLDQLELSRKALEDKYQETAFTSALELAARELNLEFELAVRLLDKTKVIFKDEKPTNLVELLRVEIERFPQLIKKQVITPEIPNVSDVSKVKTFSLHKTLKTNFFNGGGLRESVTKDETK